MWDHRLILDSAAQVLREEAERLDEEQSVRGLDALEEVDFHALLAAGLARLSAEHAAAAAGGEEGEGGWGVLREQPYPGDRTTLRRRAGGGEGAEEGDGGEEGEGGGEGWDEGEARESERQRCDLVLTPVPGLPLADPLRESKRARKRKKEVEGTLFEAVAAGGEGMGRGGEGGEGGEGGVAPEDACWVEVKLVGQYCFETGVPGPNRTYGSQLVRGAAADLAKLAKDPHIACGALLLILFTEDERIAEHDLVVAMHKCLDRGVAASTPMTSSFRVTDRIGNTVCTLALIGARSER